LERAVTRFVEFMGASGGEVFINAENIALINVGSPELSNSGLYFDPIRVYFKKGHEVERWIDRGRGGTVRSLHG